MPSRSGEELRRRLINGYQEAVRQGEEREVYISRLSPFIAELLATEPERDEVEALGALMNLWV